MKYEIKGHLVSQEVDQNLKTQRTLLSDRSCGACTMCCKLFPVPEIENKPAGKWCQNCLTGSGCKIWDKRPSRCQDYHCEWRFNDTLGAEWRPDIAKFIVNQEPGLKWVSIVVDPAQPRVWAREPYKTILKQIITDRISQGLGTMLSAGDKRYLMLPDEEIPIGNANYTRPFTLKAQIINGQKKYSISFTD